MRTECSIIHNIAGRVRLRIRSKAVVRQRGERIERYLCGQRGVAAVRLNPNCRSVIVDYDVVLTDPDSLAGDLSSFLLSMLSPHVVDGSQNGKTTERRAAAGRRRIVEAISRKATSQAGSSSNSQQSGHECFRAQPWHLLDIQDVLQATQSNAEEGLDGHAASQRLIRFGPNSLGTIAAQSGWRVLANQFTSLPVALLAGSAVVSVATAGLADAVVILGVVFVNACIGFVTEQQAERTIASLQGQTEALATVIRGGRRETIDPEWLVPGDLLVLTPGTTLGADVRLIESQRLMLDESALTGESMPVSKSTRTLSGPTVVLRDRQNMAYRGTIVTGGSGIGVAVATGLDTEVGRIQELVGLAKAPQTPMQRQLGQLGTQLGLWTGALCAGVFAFGLLRRYSTVEMLNTATSLAVAAVPEGLPMVATTTLALGVNRMRRLNVAVRRLDAVETLGSVQVFCLDKTGTLTRNQMRVVEIYVNGRHLEVDDEGIHCPLGQERPLDHETLRRLIEIAVLCNETDIQDHGGETLLDGSPTEAALIHMALSCDVDVIQLRREHPVLRTEYRTENRGYMVTCHQSPAVGRLLAVKGRPSDVLELCRWKLCEGRRVELTEHDRGTVRAANETMAGESLRVLAFALLEDPEASRSRQTNLPNLDAGLTWLGLAGIADPTRHGMKELMHTFHTAGIDTTMITGDQSGTAYAVGRRLGLNRGPELNTMDSAELESIQPDVLKSLAENVHVFSSVTPSHKLAIVKAFQRAGKVVAMTGDGINDAPALKAADIGVAMGGDGGTDVARMTADVVLQDNNLESMVTAISQGRGIYSNTRNAIRYLLSTNMSEIIVVSSAVFSGVGTPLNPMQLLWINLVSDIFPVLALAVQPPDRDVLERPPRDPDERFISHEDLVRMLIESLVISGGTFGSFAWGRLRYGRGAHASTMAFMSITAAQLLHMLSARSHRRCIFTAEQPPTNLALKAALVGGLALQAVTLVPPLRGLMRNARLMPLDLVISLLGAGIPFLVNEAIKQPAETTARRDLEGWTGEGLDASSRHSPRQAASPFKMPLAEPIP